MSNSVFAQYNSKDSLELGVNRCLKYTNYLHFNISNINYLPIKVSNYGLPSIEGLFASNFGIGLGYSYRLSNNWAINLGFDYQRPKLKFRKIFVNDTSPNEPFTIDWKENFSKVMSNNMNLNLSVSKDIFLKENLFYRFQFGAALEYITITEIGIYHLTRYPESDSIKLFLNIDLPSFKSQRRITGSYFLKTGVGFCFKDKNIINFNLVAKHAPSILSFGTYSYHNKQDISKGFLKWRASYIGIELNYSFAIQKDESEYRHKNPKENKKVNFNLN